MPHQSTRRNGWRVNNNKGEANSSLGVLRRRRTVTIKGWGNLRRGRITTTKKVRTWENALAYRRKCKDHDKPVSPQESWYDCVQIPAVRSGLEGVNVNVNVTLHFGTAPAPAPAHRDRETRRQKDGHTQHAPRTQTPMRSSRSHQETLFGASRLPLVADAALKR